MSGAAHFPLLVVGQGRAGAALSGALAARQPGGVRTWTRARGLAELAAALAGCRTLVVAVSDAALEESVRAQLLPAWPERVPGPRVALHLAGAWPSERLGALRARGVSLGVLHPVVALSGPDSADAFEGARATLSGEGPALDAARALATLLGMRAVTVDDASRPLLHLGAVMAAGDLVALLALAEAVVARAGVAPDEAAGLVAELARSALEGYARRGAAEALTGPVARADAETLGRHAEAARRAGLEELEGRAHGALAEAGAALLVRAGRLEPSVLRAIRARLAGLPGGPPAGTTGDGGDDSPAEEP